MVTKARGHGEGGIRQRKDGLWEATISLGFKLDNDGKPKRQRKSIYGKTRQEVAAKLKVALRDQQRGLPPADDRLTVAGYLTEWLARVQPPAVKPSTYRSYEQTVRLYLIPGLGRVKLSKLEPQQVQVFLDAKRGETTRTGAPFSARSIALMRAVLRQALTEAESWGKVSRNVAQLAKPPRGKARKAVSLTRERARTLLDAITGDRLEALYRLCLALGLRQGEALGLTWDEVDLDGRTLTVREGMQRVKDDATGKSALQHVGTKSETSKRTIRLPLFLVEVLRGHRTRQKEARLAAGARWQERGLVFCTRYGTPLDGPNVTKYFQRHLDAAGLPQMRFHDLRHSAVSFMAAEGVPVEVARAILGHSDARLTMNVYRHILPDEHDQAADAIDRLYGGM